MNLERLRTVPHEDALQTYTARDTMLYALGLGLGDEPTDERQLRYVYEKDLLAFPTFANVMCRPANPLMRPEFGIDFGRLVHGEQRMVLHRTLAPAGTLRGTSRVTSVVDKGPGKGALVDIERNLHDAQSGEHVATISSAYLCRGDGGAGGFGAEREALAAVPQRAPDHQATVRSLPQSALIYRLSGDYNPLHADPRVAREAGFDRPILHGLCTLGMAARVLVAMRPHGVAEALRSISVRFSAPVFPGDELAVSVWETGEGTVSFEARVRARDARVLTCGAASF